MNKFLYFIIVVTFSIVFNYQSTAQSTAIFGESNLNASVSGNGRVNFNLPIYTSPGINGMVPNISINITNSKMQGIIGNGGFLTGISYIQRIGRNYHRNGAQEPITFTNNDLFEKDGETLQLKNGTYGQNGSEYGTESTDFSNIKFKGNYFFIENKNGGVDIYGSQNNAILNLGSSPLPFRFYLFRRYDKNGNYLEYNYFFRNGQHLLKEVLYTGYDGSIFGTKVTSNPTILPFNKIVLEYENSTNHNEIFVSGYPEVMSNRLIEIKSICNYNTTNTIVRKYLLEYKTYQFGDYLNSITEVNKLGELKHPIKFNFTESNTNVSRFFRCNELNTRGRNSKITNNILSGDFGGNGETSLLFISDINKEIFQEISEDIKIINVNNQNNPITIFKNNLSNLFPIPSKKNYYIECHISDLNADGVSDILFQISNYEIEYVASTIPISWKISRCTTRFHALLGNRVPKGSNLNFTKKLDYFKEKIKQFNPNTTWIVGSEHEKVFTKHYRVNSHLGEFDGDGLPDLMIDEKIGNLTPVSNIISILFPIWNSNISDVSLASNYSNLSILYGKNPQVEFLSNLNNTAFTNLKFPIQTGDFNNDGKHEFIVFHNSFDAIIYGWNNNSTPIIFNSNISTNSITSFKLCDFNNDGNIDIFYRESSGYWKVKYCNGQSGFNNETIVLNENGTYNIDAGIVNELGINISNQSTINSNFTIGDFNGDNLFDIYLASKNLQSKIFYSNGNDFKSESINYPYSVTYSKFTKLIQSIDVNGDGTFDVIGKDHDGFLTFPYNKETLNSIENAHIKYSFKESMLSKSSNFNESTYNPPLQSIKLVPKIMVVEELIETRHDKFYKKNKYYYQDYIYNRHGFGGLGFAKVAIYNTTDRQTLIEKRIPITPLFSNLIPISLETKINCDYTNGINESGQLISDEKNSYKVIKPITNNDNIIFQALTFKTKNDYINGNQIELCYEYDNFGNIKMIKEKHALISNLNNPEFLSIQQNTFFKINSWIPSSLIKTEIYQKRRNLNGNFETPYSRVEHFEYDGFGRLTLVKNNTGNPNKYLATRTVYDQFGNTIQTSSENSNATNLRKTEYVYQNGRFITSSKDMNSTITSYIVNPETGNKLQENLSFNKSNFWEYDAWGKLTKSINFTGITTNYVYLENSFTTTNQSGIHRIVKETKNSGEENIEYINPIGQVFKIQQTTFALVNTNGKTYKTKDFEYAPYFEIGTNNISGLKTKESNWYDEAKTNDTKRTTQFEYDNLRRLIRVFKKPSSTEVTLTSFTFSPNKITTAKRVSRALTNNKQIIKNSSGLVFKTIENFSLELLINYGSHNKPISMITPGETKTFEYDDNLNIIKQNEQTSGEIISTYNEFNELVFSKDQNGNELTYVYDIFGRQIEKTVNSGQSYSYEFFSDPLNASYGKLRQIELKELGIPIHKQELKYNSKGLSSEIWETHHGKTIKTYYNYDQFGRLYTKDYPNITTRNNYDLSGNLIEVELLKKSTNSYSSFWKIDQALPDERLKKVLLGNSVTQDYEYNTIDLALSEIQCYNSNNNSITDYLIIKDENLIDGNISKISAPNYEETYQYDVYDRLINFNVNDFTNSTNSLNTTEFDTKGNLENKYNIGSFEYDDKPNSPSSNTLVNGINLLTINPNLTENQQFTYNYLNKVISLQQGNKELMMEYGVDGNRIFTKIVDNGIPIQEIEYFNSASTEFANTDEITYIYIGSTPIAMYKKNTDELYYFHLDVMGSLVAITDESGILLESRNYDPWGKPRNPQTLAYTLSNPFGGSISSYTLRGYTFHEHYEMFDLINMNGRLYDNQIGQFINADPILADNENLQNYNRYSYVMNNPLKYTDPSGYVYTGGGGAGTYGSGTSMEEISFNSRETEKFERGIQEVKESFLGDFFMSIAALFTRKGPQIAYQIDLNEYVASAARKAEPVHKVVSGTNYTLTQNLQNGGIYTPYYQMDWGNGNNKNLATSTLGFIAADIYLPDPTDAVWIKWAAYGIAGTAAASYLLYAGNGNSNYPGPLVYTYEHPSQNPTNTAPIGFNPNEAPPGIGTAIKWSIGIRSLYELYDEYNSRINLLFLKPNLAPIDTTSHVSKQTIQKIIR